MSSLIRIWKEEAKQLASFGDQSLYISYPYDSEMQFRAQKVKTITTRRYDPKEKSWEFPLDQLDNVIGLFPRNELKIDRSILETLSEDTARDIESGSFEDYKTHLARLKPIAPFFFKTKPDPHQIESFNRGIKAPKLLLADEQGLGKSKEAIDIVEYLRLAKGYKKGIVVAKASLKFNWALEIMKHGRSRFVIVDHTNAGKRMAQIYQFINDPGIYYLIIGYEGIKIDLCNSQKRHTDRGKVYTVFSLKPEFNVPIDFLIVDEPTKVKNPTADVTKAFLALFRETRPKTYLPLTGTPMKKRIEDLWVLLNTLGAYQDNFWNYCKDYTIKDKFGNTIGYKGNKIPELHARLKSVMLRRTKDLLDLPEKRTSDILVKMPEEQAKIYKAVRDAILVELEDTKVSSIHPLAILTRLRQVTTCPALIEHGAPSGKEQMLLEMLEEMNENGQKAIIYSIYKEETKRLKELLEKYNSAYIDGTIKPKDRQGQVNKFQEDPDCKVLIGTLDSCKEGFTMTAATNVIFMDLSWTYTDNIQAEDRAHRKGQSKMVNVYRLVCENTVDHRVIEILEEDQSLIEEAVEGKGIKKVKKELIMRLLS